MRERERCSRTPSPSLFCDAHTPRNRSKLGHFPCKHCSFPSLWGVGRAVILSTIGQLIQTVVHRASLSQPRSILKADSCCPASLSWFLLLHFLPASSCLAALTVLSSFYSTHHNLLLHQIKWCLFLLYLGLLEQEPCLPPPLNVVL